MAQLDDCADLFGVEKVARWALEWSTRRLEAEVTRRESIFACRRADVDESAGAADGLLAE
jgi:hypothetical protein